MTNSLIHTWIIHSGKRIAELEDYRQKMLAIDHPTYREDISTIEDEIAREAEYIENCNKMIGNENE